MRQVFRRCFAKAGIAVKAMLHTLGYSFATYQLEHGPNFRYIQTLGALQQQDHRDLHPRKTQA
ncbi:hypothetical protein [Adhaeribacter pallidiroseus]|uniref:Uncharacterized protein n=1 Tax=Adhaeribacter pallidiroseus TaxID=2072847 RepID=A0A369QHM4_9BACT|nr:hypothetical protein [Adhaeribacter pallidiroseus]RDC64413.1 hypothetical protein AHMF7616_03027 [Adhaeribacter pallidiroseus]